MATKTPHRPQDGAFNKGVEAAKKKQGIKTNPYHLGRGSAFFKAWEQGYRSART